MIASQADGFMMVLDGENLTIRNMRSGYQITIPVATHYALTAGLQLAHDLEYGNIDADIEIPLKDIVQSDSIAPKLRDLFRGINGKEDREAN